MLLFCLCFFYFYYMKSKQVFLIRAYSELTLFSVWLTLRLWCRFLFLLSCFSGFHKKHLSIIQLLQNSAARVLTETRSLRIVFKITLVVYKCPIGFVMYCRPWGPLVLVYQPAPPGCCNVLFFFCYCCGLKLQISLNLFEKTCNFLKIYFSHKVVLQESWNCFTWPS